MSGNQHLRMPPGNDEAVAAEDVSYLGGAGFGHFWKGVRGKTIRQLTANLGQAAAET